MTTTGKKPAAPAGPGTRAPDSSVTPHAGREALREAPGTVKAPESSGLPKPSVGPALKALGAATGSVFGALAGTARDLWRTIHWLIRGLAIWAGIPIAVGIFGVSAAYHLLGFYLEAQADALKQGRAQIAALRKERQELKAKLEGALAEADQAKEQARKASDAAGIATKRLAAVGGAPATLGSQLGGVSRSDRPGQPARKQISMPCDLAGPAAGYEAKLSQCLREYNDKSKKG